jgi:hypothetical protein
MYVKYGLLYFILYRPKLTVRAMRTVQCVMHRVRPFRLKNFFASKRIVSEQRSVSHEIRLFTSSIRFPFFAFFDYFRFKFFATIRFNTVAYKNFQCE